MYHIIAEPKSHKESRFACPPALFRKHMKYLRENSYNVVNLDAILKHVHDRSPVPDKTVVVTLDDGFRNNYDNAFPIFQEFNIPATIFLASGMIEKTNSWMHENSFPKRSMLTWANIREMKDWGIHFGAHTVNHVKLTELTAEEKEQEIRQSKIQIEDKLGEEISHFAYPYGLMDETAREKTVEAGFSTACSTRSGFNNYDSDLFILRRLEVYGNDSIRALKQKLTFGVNNSEVTYAFKYYAKQVMRRLGSR